MTTEFPGRFMRLFGGPMWSGQPIENRQDPRKVFSMISIDFAFYRMSYRFVVIIIKLLIKKYILNKIYQFCVGHHMWPYN